MVLTAMDQKPQKSLKRWYYPPKFCTLRQVLGTNMHVKYKRICIYNVKFKILIFNSLIWQIAAI